MLNLLIEAYVATSFANPEFAAIYYTERVNLTRVDEELLRSVQRTTIDSWMRLLTSARSEAHVDAGAHLGARGDGPGGRGH